jgi:hypothetical protein
VLWSKWKTGASIALGETLFIHPMIIKLGCVAAVVVVVFPLGMMLFPYLTDDMGGTPFKTLEAVLSATLGFGLYAALFG